MKKRMSLLILLLGLMVSATGCGNEGCGSARNIGGSGSVEEVLFEKISEGEAIEDGNVADAAETVTDEEKAIENNAVAITTDTATDEKKTIEENNTATAVEDPKESPAPGVDVDLTVLSSTMVYSEVYNMMVAPEDYKGKTVKMKGQFVPYYDESTGKYYFACFISDATACCSQGIEFILTDEYSYPDDYPKEGDTFCVVGTYDTYMEGENMYCTLRDAVLK